MNLNIDHETRVASLKTIKHFRDLEYDQLLELSKITTLRTLSKNEIIFEQGTVPANFTFVNKGLVKLVRSLKPGQEMILRLVTEGDCFGSIAIFNESTYLARAICDGEVTLIEIPVDPFMRFMDRHPGIARKFLKYNSQKSQKMTRKVPEMALNRIESRVAKILLNLTEKIGYKENDVYQVQIPLTRKEIAAMAGTTTETVVRVLGKLEKGNIIEINRHHIKLKDLDYLEGLVDELDHLP